MMASDNAAKRAAATNAEIAGENFIGRAAKAPPESDRSLQRLSQKYSRSQWPASAMRSGAVHQRSAGGRPLVTSAMRARLPPVVSGGSASRGKNPCAEISRFGRGNEVWRKSRTI